MTFAHPPVEFSAISLFNVVSKDRHGDIDPGERVKQGQRITYITPSL